MLKRNFKKIIVSYKNLYLNPKSEKYTRMIEWIRKYLNITTLKYQTLDDMIEAIGLPKENLCTYCWNGKDCDSKCVKKF